jgi:hypothetical protein
LVGWLDSVQGALTLAQAGGGGEQATHLPPSLRFLKKRIKIDKIMNCTEYNIKN